jgi:hypothetical protein
MKEASLYETFDSNMAHCNLCNHECKINEGKRGICGVRENRIHFCLFKTETVLSFLEKKPSFVELILTGRYCPPEIIEKADLVTEMHELKHYYQKGIEARKGIES